MDVELTVLYCDLIKIPRLVTSILSTFISIEKVDDTDVKMNVQRNYLAL